MGAGGLGEGPASRTLRAYEGAVSPGCQPLELSLCVESLGRGGGGAGGARARRGGSGGDGARAVGARGAPRQGSLDDDGRRSGGGGVTDLSLVL